MVLNFFSNLCCCCLFLGLNDEMCLRFCVSFIDVVDISILVYIVESDMDCAFIFRDIFGFPIYILKCDMGFAFFFVSWCGFHFSDGL